MTQQFDDIPDTTWTERFRTAVRGGGVQRIVGAALIAVLAIAGGAGALFSDRLNAGSAAEQYHPPHNWVLQRLLYHPVTQIDTVRQQDTSDPFQLGSLPQSAEAETDETASVPTITSTPRYTAAVDDTYRYEVAADGETEHTYAFGQRPSGMEIDAESGVITWTPPESQVGTVPVEVQATNADGRGTMQRYTLYVSSERYPLGTEQNGRGMGAALVLGARWALLPGCIAVFVSMLLGVLIGGLAGYYEKTADAVLTYVSNLTEALPALVLLVLAAVIFQYNIFLIMIVVGIIWFPRVANTIKSKVQSLKARQFVEAARELGLRDRDILWREIIWHNARPQLLLQASYGFVFAIIVEVTLSYLQLGIKAPTISWGILLYQGRSELVGNFAYWPVVLPSMAIVGSVTAFYVLADGIQRAYASR